jgi:hypothetical protein
MFEESASPKLPFHQCLPRAQSPFCPSGEKVAVRPDGGISWDIACKNGPLSPALSPDFLQERCHVTPRCIRKKSGERGQHGAVQLGSIAWRSNGAKANAGGSLIDNANGTQTWNENTRVRSS